MSSCASTSHDSTSCFLSVFLCLFCFQVCWGSVPLHLPPLCLNATRTRHQRHGTLLIFFFHSTTRGGVQDGQPPQAPLRMTWATHASDMPRTTQASTAPAPPLSP